MEVKEIPIKDIKIVENHRSNIEETKLEELMQSIKQHGFKSPIDVRPAGKSKYELISGARRLMACQKLGYDKIYAQISQNVDSKKFTLLNLTENIQRSDPSFAEIGRAIEKLYIEDKMTYPQIAVRLGKTEKEIKGIITTYHALPVEHRKNVKFLEKGKNREKGTIPHTLATHLASIKKQYSMSPDVLDQLIKHVLKTGMSKESLTNLAGMLNQGLTVEDAIKKMEQYHVYHFEICASTSLIQRLMEEHKCKESSILFKKIVYGQINGIPKPDFIKLKD